MTESIHSFPIADDDWHHVSCRCSGVDAELAKFLVKVIGVFPEGLPQSSAVADGDLQCFEETSDDDWWQRARINVRMRIKSQILQGLFRSGDKSADGAERLRKGAVDQWNAVFHSKLFGRAATV